MTDFIALFTQLGQDLESHAQALAVFSVVGRHEPDNDPGSGIACAIVIGPITPARSSGLSITSFRVEYAARIYVPALTRPLDDLDPRAAGAACALMASLSAEFTLAGAVREIDLLGAEGQPMAAMPGWLEQSGKKFRTVDVTIPLIVNDVFPQEA